MADRILTWYIPGVLSETGVQGTNVSTEFVLDGNYTPDVCQVRSKDSVQGGATSPSDLTPESLDIDINDDGTSIFRQVPRLLSGTGRVESSAFTDGVLEDGSIVTLDIDRIPNEISGKDLTVHLELSANDDTNE